MWAGLEVVIKKLIEVSESEVGLDPNFFVLAHPLWIVLGNIFFYCQEM